MDTKKSLDLAAGRLTRGPRPGRSRQNTSYGTGRLGLALEPDSGPDEPPSDRSKPKVAIAPAPAAESPTDERLGREPAPPAARAPGLPYLDQLPAWVRAPWVLAATGTGVALLLLAWLLWPAPTNAVAQPKPKPVIAPPAAPTPAAPPSTPREPVARTVSTRPADVSAGGERVGRQVDPQPARARHPAPAAKELPTQMASLLRWVRRTGVAAARRSAAAEPTAQHKPPPAETARLAEPPAPSPPPAPPAAPARASVPSYVPCPPGFRFTGAIRQPNGWRANLNGRFVPVGAKVNKARVVRIGRSSVEMEREGRHFFVGFGRSRPKPAQPVERDGEASDEVPPQDKGSARQGVSAEGPSSAPAE